jgi:hypothetical protein
MWKPGGHHQRAVRYALIAGNGEATTQEMLAYCFPRAGGVYQHWQRSGMIRAARKFATSVRYGRWMARPELMARIKN